MSARASLAIIALCASACGSTGTDPVSFSSDVAPLLQSRCVSCHRSGGIAPFVLTSYEDAKANAPAIKAATSHRTMPPWAVDNTGACNTFENARWLSDEQIDLIGRWVDEGAADVAPGGSRSSQAVAAAPAPIDTTTIEPTLTLDIGADWTPPDSLPDIYRCFIVDPALTEDRFLTGYEVLPGSPRIVHHVIVFAIDTPEGETQVDALDARDEGPGYTCFGGSLLSFQTTRPIAAWAPGTGATRYPEASGVRVHAGRRMVVQVHYHTENGVEPDRTRVDLELVGGVDRPAEIVGVADLGLEVPPGIARYATEPVRLVPGIGGFIRGVFPHMHRLGVSQSSRLIHTDDSSTCLTEVPAWDFDWQQFYFLSRPIYVSSTDRIELGCTYDTESRTEPVRWGEGTNDEMCLLGLYVTLN